MNFLPLYLGPGCAGLMTVPDRQALKFQRTEYPLKKRLTGFYSVFAIPIVIATPSTSHSFTDV